MSKSIYLKGCAVIALCALSACKEKEQSNQNDTPSQQAISDESSGKGGEGRGQHQVHVKLEGAAIHAVEHDSDSALISVTIQNNGDEDKLIGIQAEGIKSCHIEDHLKEGAAHPLKEVIIPAKKSVAFGPKGLSLTLKGLPHGGLQKGAKVKVTFTFQKAGAVSADVSVA